ncbi:CsiV family protein [Alteromonas sp. RKMC-009]|uniref:CsiV family protein n=1 Tax=Alteromonas sp. RKMC-009 TaxID=2267264 RepID=UPI000E69E3C6|nr:CsiV family protein [Alteromonas sp. RKMC-009]AYA64725.1 hypothetical protein DS731_12300 [Alteromonas sp. RKMC-009]
MKRVVALAAGLLLNTASPVFAADDWWFDVEVIIFDRNLSISELNEQFTETPLAQSVAELNLIDNYLRPDISYIKQGLATCGVPSSPLWMDTPSLEDIQADYARWKASQSLLSENTGTGADNTGLSDSRPSDFSSAPDLSDETELSQQNREDALAEAFSEETGNDGFSSGEVAVADEEPVTPAFDPVIDSEIAEYWIAFSGINTVKPVTVPRFSYCEPPRDWLSWQNGKWQTYKPDNSLPAPDVVPEFLDGRNTEFARFAHLLPYDSLELTKLSRQIRQTRGLNRMLHIAWRQPVKFGEQKAAAMRIIAGDNYADSFTMNGEAIKPALPQPAEPAEAQEDLTLTQDDFFTQLSSRLNRAGKVSFDDMMAAGPEQIMQADTAQNTTVAQANEGLTPAIWQLDGFLKVYLKYINRVPYLHIDSEMQYRQPVTTGESENGQPEFELQAVPFHQVRRVISKQIHYFDHPIFGMIVQIRRHQQ